MNEKITSLTNQIDSLQAQIWDLRSQRAEAMRAVVPLAVGDTCQLGVTRIKIEKIEAAEHKEAVYIYFRRWLDSKKWSQAVTSIEWFGNKGRITKLEVES